MKHLKPLFLLITLLIFSACKGDQAPVNSRLGINNVPFNFSSGMRIRWSDAALSSPLNVSISTDFTNDFVAADLVGGLNPVDQMMKEWNEAVGGRTFYTVPSATGANRDYGSLSSYHDDEMGIYRSYGWFDDVSSSAMAVTQFFGLRKTVGAETYLELVHADIIFNYRDFTFSTDKDDLDNYDLHSVLLHELGHFVGLKHTSLENPSVMQPYLSVFDSQRQLFQLDKDNLATNYLAPGTQALQVHALSSEKEDEVVRGVVELRKDGQCRHYLDGKLIESHQTSF